MHFWNSFVGPNINIVHISALGPYKSTISRCHITDKYLAHISSSTTDRHFTLHRCWFGSFCAHKQSHDIHGHQFQLSERHSSKNIKSRFRSFTEVSTQHCRRLPMTMRRGSGSGEGTVKVSNFYPNLNDLVLTSFYYTKTSRSLCERKAENGRFQVSCRGIETTSRGAGWLLLAAQANILRRMKQTS